MTDNRTTESQESGTLTAEQVKEAIERHSSWVVDTINCFYFNDGTYEAIADELNAEVGGTCELIYDDEGILSCSRCGRHVSMIIASEDNFCSGCGRRIQKAVKR